MGQKGLLGVVERATVCLQKDRPVVKFTVIVGLEDIGTMELYDYSQPSTPITMELNQAALPFSKTSANNG